MKKKLLCLLLSLCVAISMFPAVAWAEGGAMQDVTFDWDNAPTSLNAGAESGYALSVNEAEKTATLTLKNVRITNEINIPYDTCNTLKIKLIGNNEIANITGNALYYCDIFRAEEAEGTAKLTIGSLPWINGEEARLQIGENTDVTVNAPLNICASGSNGGYLDINGSLTVDTTNAKELDTDGAAVTLGFCTITGTSAHLKINTACKYGLRLSGKYGSQSTPLYTLQDVLKITDGGKLSVKTTSEAVGAAAVILYREINNVTEAQLANLSDLSDILTRNEGDLTIDTEKAFNLPDGYLGEKYGTCGELASRIDEHPMGYVLRTYTARVYIIDFTQEAAFSVVQSLNNNLDGTDNTNSTGYLPAKEVNIPVDGWNAGQTPTSSSSSRTKFYDVFTEAENGTIEVEGSVIRLVSHIFARRGAELTVTPKAADGYKLTAFYVDGEAIDMSTAASYKFNIYKDTTVKAEFEKTQEQLIKEARAYAGSVKLIAKSELVKRTNGKKAVKVYWYEKSGKKLYFDGYEIYRSVKKSEYGKKPIFTTKKLQYLNTAVEKGTRYYYKVRGYNEFGSVKIFSDWSTQAWRKVR